MTSERSPRSGLALREFLTPPAMWARYGALCRERADVRTTSYILGTKDAQLEWLHSVGVVQDAALAALAAPVPPVKLRRNVADPDAEAFLWTGFVDLVQIISCFETHHARDSGEPFDVLDFGCGCGRLLRFFQPVAAHWRACGADANPELVSWCRARLPSATVVRNAVDGELEFPSGRFDLIYCLSVFTHLPEDKASFWLKELARLLRPGGILVATIHGETALDTIRASAAHQSMFDITSQEATGVAEELSRAGFIYRRYQRNTLAVANVGEDYGNSFISPDYVRHHWTAHDLEVCEVLPGGLRGWQDLVVLRRCP
jgi:SAM-dependent methyltransferase